MRILDLFCGAGGAGVGYSRAGFEVVGVDIKPQKNYPFDFYQGSAVNVYEDGATVAIGALNILVNGGTILASGNAYRIEDFDAIHSSPPCQSSSALTKGTNQGMVYPDFIPQTRELLEESGLPYVIENVQGSAVRRDVVLCGEMFGLGVIRHRYFELNWTCIAPTHIPHRGRVAGWRHGVYYDGPYVAVYGDGGGKGNMEQWKTAMGIDWMTGKKELAESIPPAYTEYLGGYLLKNLAPGS